MTDLLLSFLILNYGGNDMEVLYGIDDDEEQIVVEEEKNTKQYEMDM